jgi:gamma-glutamylcyclotransferase (GGCT)/AIG2-like uncharacterized protein YtfP
MAMRRIFVYGTLMKGEYNHYLLESSRFLDNASTRAEFDLFDLGLYPAMAEQGRLQVKGEIYEVDDSALAMVDMLEDHPNWYTRTKIRLSNGETVETYIMPRRKLEGFPIIESGDWRNRNNELRVPK